MGLSARENWLRAVEFRHPEWIPCSVGFSLRTIKTCGPDLEAVVLEHPRLFPHHRKGQWDSLDEMPVVYRQGEYYTDNWGCTWYNEQEGLEGQVVRSPLEDWASLKTYQMPDPDLYEERGPRDWAAVRRGLAEARESGQLAVGNGERLFDRLYFLRGFENLMVDLATCPPELQRLIDMLEAYEQKVIARNLAFGVDAMAFHTDFGAQTSLMMSPAAFRRYIKPLFMHLFQPLRRQGVHVSLSSDGHVLEVVDDLIECGVSVHDPQERANTVPGIVEHYKGKLCANVDLDRQAWPFLTPAEIRDRIRRVVDAMAMPEGGLMLATGIFGDDVPIRSIEAICATMEEVCFPS